MLKVEIQFPSPLQHIRLLNIIDGPRLRKRVSQEAKSYEAAITTLVALGVSHSFRPYFLSRPELASQSKDY